MAGFDAIYKFGEFKYADGKLPLDFTDVINFHYYSGRTAPRIGRYQYQRRPLGRSDQ